MKYMWARDREGLVLLCGPISIPAKEPAALLTAFSANVSVVHIILALEPLLTWNSLKGS